jgi:hypothetical protein
MNDKLDVSLVDTVLLAELELTTNLIIAASQSERHLSQVEIDALLGVPSARTIPRQVGRAQAPDASGVGLPRELQTP